MSLASAAPFQVGRFLITPLSRDNAHGQFTASLSIRRGHGSQTHDRVYTFTPAFIDRESALAYASVQGRYWLINPMAYP